MVLLGDEAQLKARFSPFGDSGNIDARWVHGLRRMYHRLGIILDAPDGTPRCVRHAESCFGPFGDSVSVGAR